MMTKKLMNCLIGALALFAFENSLAYADQLDVIRQRGKIVIGVKNDYKPFGFLGSDGSLQGLDVDLAKFVGTEIMGSPGKVELVPVVTSNRIELLNQGRVDIIIATLGRTEERAKVLDYSDNYYMLGEGAVVAPINSKIKTWSDLKGTKVCGILGDTFNRTFSETYGAQMLLFPGSGEMFKAFEDNRCDAIGWDEPLLRQRVVEGSWKGKYAVVLPAKSFAPLAAGVRKHEPILLDAVNKAIAKALATGVLTAAESKYNLGPSASLKKQGDEVRPLAKQ
jgi:polar amino acid transport system substrate-binding protein